MTKKQLPLLYKCFLQPVSKWTSEKFSVFKGQGSSITTVRVTVDLLVLFHYSLLKKSCKNNDN